MVTFTLVSQIYGFERGFDNYRTLHERPTNGVDPVLRKTIRKFRNERLDAAWMQAQQLKVQPQITVVPRLQQEVSLAGVNELIQFLQHGHFIASTETVE